MMGDVIEGWMWWRNVIIGWRRVVVELTLPLAQRRVLPLLVLAKDVDCVL
jgi:hypothetical protein